MDLGHGNVLFALRRKICGDVGVHVTQTVYEIPVYESREGGCVHYSLVGSEVVICGVDYSLYIRFGFFRSSHLLCVFYHRYSRVRCFVRYILGLDLLTYPGLSSECAFRYMCVVKIYSVDLGI